MLKADRQAQGESRRAGSPQNRHEQSTDLASSSYAALVVDAVGLCSKARYYRQAEGQGIEYQGETKRSRTRCKSTANKA